MKLLRQFFLAATLSILGLTTLAQTVETTPNLVTNIRSSHGHGVWLGTGGNSQLGGVHPIELWGCCTSYSGSSPFFDTSTTNGNGQSGQIIWSYGNATVNHIVAINQALSGSGVQINGYNWSYDLRNNNGGSGQNGVDTLTATSRLWNSTYSTVLLQQSRTHNTRMDWTTFSSTVTAATPHPLANVGNLQLEFRSADSGFWGGYYGPQIRDVQASFNYTIATIDPCVGDPLSSSACPGYAQAFFNQQCSANPLYSSGCPGYTQAMCSSNPLFSTTCPGYQQAFFNQQCTANTLYNVNCPGYAVAFLDYQCSLDSLYSTTCSGYAAAYFTQQCSLDSLYDVNCPGYAAAYFTQQCSLDGLYDRQCPNYATAYATKMLVQPTVEISQTVVPVAAVSEQVTKVETAVSPAAAVSTVPLVAAPAPATSTVVTAAPAPAKTTATAPAASKDKPQTARQALTERRQAAARAAAVEQGKNLASDMGKAADMEAQIAVQNVVIAAMGFTPGFDAYSKAMIPDAVGYRPFTIYNNQKNVDNRFLGSLMFGPSDRLHNELVDSQYNK